MKPISNSLPVQNNPSPLLTEQHGLKVQAFITGMIACLALGFIGGYIVANNSQIGKTNQSKLVVASPTPISTGNQQKKNTYVLPAWILTPTPSPSPTPALVGTPSATIFPRYEQAQFSDRNILAVQVDVNNLNSASDFPDGFFNHNPTSWGIVYPDKGPITVTVEFVRPIKLAYISNSFNGCYDLSITENFSCYDWSVRGLTKDNNVEDILTGIKGNIRSVVQSDSEFNQIQISVENTGKQQGEIKPSISWEKILFGYK